MSHNCNDCGLEHEGPDVPAVVEVDPEPAADAAVRIAEIEAGRDVAVARIGARVEEGWQESRVAELEGQLAGMRDTLTRLAPPAPDPDPDPDPTPVIIDDPAPEPEPVVESTAEPPPAEAEPVSKRDKKGNPWW